jgi:hypothetical protein
MKKFNNTKLWTMLNNSVSATNGSAKADTDAILEEFASEITDYCRQESNLAERLRTLQFAQGDLGAISKQPDFGEDDDCIRKMIERAIAKPRFSVAIKTPHSSTARS